MFLLAEVTFAVVDQYGTSTVRRSVLRPHLDVLPAGIFSVYLLLPDQSPGLCVDAVVCTASGGVVLDSGRGRIDSRLESAEFMAHAKLAIFGKCWRSGTDWILSQPASVLAGP